MKIITPKVEGYLRSLVNFKYVKLTILSLSMVFAYAFFSWYRGTGIIKSAQQFGILASFFAGMLYAFGFTAPFAVGILLSLDPGANFWFVALSGGLGALFADYIILKFVRLSFQDEFDRLKKTRQFRYVKRKFDLYLPEKIKEYSLLAMAGFFIASPLPDEIGVSLLAGFTNIEDKKFGVMSFILNTAGIIVLLML